MAAEVSSAFSFLGEEHDDSPQLQRRRSFGTSMSFPEFATTFFQDKSASNASYMRAPLKGPLLKQIWGDGDSERALSVWVAILRFLGDLPPAKTKPMTNLQLVQLICNVAISRPKTRDEIYCQICKQLTGNPNKASHARGWILLALICGCVAPSENFLPTLRAFLDQGPPVYKPFIRGRLQRTEQHGNRKEPPCSIELQAAFTKKGIDVLVGFYIGTLIVKMDSQSNAAEVAAELWKNPLIHPEAGFSIYVCSKNLAQMTPIGLGAARVMDTIYTYEQLSEDVRGQDDWRQIQTSRPWQVLLRKEVFSPWPESWDNVPVIYAQIMDGMERGLYLCDSDEDLALLMAQRYYIQHGHKFSSKTFLKMLGSHGFAGSSERSNQEWASLAEAAFHKNEYQSGPCTELDMQTDVVDFARRNWFMAFSRSFPNCDVTIDGRAFKLATVHVNSEGVFVEKQAKNTTRAGGRIEVVASSLFVNMVDVGPIVTPSEDGQLPKFLVTTAATNGKIVTVVEAEPDQLTDLHTITSKFFKGLRLRSKYVMATVPYKSPGSGSTFLSFEQADLIVLQKMWSEAEEGAWCVGICERTKKQGDFPTANVLVLPTMTRPTADVLARFAAYCKTVIDNDDDDDI